MYIMCLHLLILTCKYIDYPGSYLHAELEFAHLSSYLEWLPLLCIALIQSTH